MERLARELDADVLYEPLEPNVSGFLVHASGRVAIAVNSLHHSNRQRFTLSHEIGHLVLHQGSPTVFVDDIMVHFRSEDSGGVSDPREAEANEFAAALLMPEACLRQDLREQFIDAFDDVAVRHLATRYSVSSQALTIRLSRLGFIDGMPSFNPH